MKMTDDTNKALPDVDRLLADAAGRPTEPSPDLVRRVLADADVEQPQQRPILSNATGVVENLRRRVGQWSAVGGLVAASTVGFWFGIDPPAMLEDVGLVLQAGMWEDPGADPAELSGFGWALEES